MGLIFRTRVFTILVIEIVTDHISTNSLVYTATGPTPTNVSVLPTIKAAPPTDSVVSSTVSGSSIPPPSDSDVSPTLFGSSIPPSTVLPWLDRWRYEIQGYLNASGITDSNRRFVIENQMYYCPATRLCNVNFNPPAINWDFGQPCCGLEWCSCTVDCIEKGTCCADFATQLVKDDALNETCVLPQFRKFMPDGKNHGHSYFMRSKCLENFKNKTVVQFCENIDEHPRTLESFLSHVPVTSFVTYKIYRNIYCAICNEEDEQQLLIWKTSVSCDKKVFVFPRSFISLLDYIQREKLCNIFYYSSSYSVYPKKCSWGVGITKCNHTGEISTYDPVLELGCNSYTSLYNGYYRNVHCFMCNHKEIPSISNCSSGKTSPFDMAAFSALLDFNVFNEEEQAKDRLMHKDDFRSCSPDEIDDEYKNVCRPIECLEGFVYFNNTCRRIYTEENLKSYEVFFRSSIAEIECLNITCILGDIENFVKRKLPNNLERHLCAVNVILDGEHLYCNNSNFLDFEKESTNVIIHIEVSSLRFHEVEQFISEILSLQDEPIIITNSTCGNILQQELHLRTDSYNYGKNGTFGTLDRKYIKPGTSQSLTFGSLVFSEMFICKSPLRLVRVMNNIACPRISLHKWEYNFTFVNGDLCIKGIDECFRSGYYTNKTDKIIVCKDDYLSRIASLKTVEPPKCQTTVDYVLNMITFICLILSMGCLVITLVIYCCFRELRTIPGKNNMLLSINLLIAQLLFLFGSGKNELETGCTIIGLFLHLFWLISLFMMSSSTIHMVRVFAVFEKPKNFEVQSNSALVKYTIYSFTMSGIFVLINVVSSLLKSGGKEMGYGGCICYISTKLMVGITFALPVGIVVLSNFILFVIVMVSIQKLSNLKTSSGNHRNTFVIYIKLSCLTGLTWVFGFINEIIQSKVLSYLFVVFNAGQGIYIMLAFMCNKRVFRLLIPSFKKSAKSKRRYNNTSGNGSTESKQTLTSCSSRSNLVESKMAKCYSGSQKDFNQSENTRL